DYVSDNLTVSLTDLRALLATPAGPLEADGDVRLVRNVPISAVLRLQPTALAWKDAHVVLRAASLNYEGNKDDVHFSGDAAHMGQVVRGMDAALAVSGLHWSGQNLSATQAHLQASAQSSGPVSEPKLDLTASNVTVTGADVSADLSAMASAGMHTNIVVPHDAALTRAVVSNLARLNLNFAGHVEKRGRAIKALFSVPIRIKGAHGAVLQLAGLAVSGSSDSLSASFKADLGGGGLPPITASVDNLVWSGGGFTASTAFSTRLSYAMLHDATLSTRGVLSWQSGRYAFVPKACSRISLAAFHPGDSDLAKDIRATLCPVGAQPLIAGEGARWKFSGVARDTSAFLPLANAQVEPVAGTLAFEGVGGDFHGQVTGLTGQISDKTTPARFKPVLGSGTIALANGVWRGQLAVSSSKKARLGDVTFQHVMATGAGSAHIAAPHLAFAPDKLVPEDLSALLAAFRKANGAIDFQGDIAWTRDTLASRGILGIDSLDFLTPLGTAHAIKTKLEFTSLLPPRTAENQQLTISRIDWTLPFSSVDLHFSFDPTLVKVSALSSGWADGKASLDAFSVNPTHPGQIAGAAQFKSITLESLIAASNLGSKLKLTGKISGRVPFTFGPDGLHVANGHIASDGPGRLSVDRSLWMQGDAAISSNAVQDFAYQALENLAFDSMSADLNSVAGGRLQIVFHIKGHSDPPKPQTANVAITDIINGTALYKPIPLPSNTPIDLTLDTSLNFDELLKSYAQAWSKSLNPQGAADAPGAKP
ncbi:MAG TPA: YdbH domain-containing protein, partial [Rhizomicrobium sp.]|nr:YdbH domain-containing protein [Rhizomicrobium sp.]